MDSKIQETNLLRVFLQDPWLSNFATTLLLRKSFSLEQK